MLQIVYVSSANQIAAPDGIAAILRVSRRNNGRDGITGLLYADGTRFLQALEGPADRVEAAYARICKDDRHRAAVILSRRTVATREFGAWQMAHRAPGDDAAAFLDQVAGLVADASPRVRATFEGFAAVRSAAA